MLQTVGSIFFLVLFIYLAMGVGYIFLVSVAGKLRRGNRYQPAAEKKSIAVIIPSYKEDSIIVDTARRAAAHNYPTGKFQVFVIADGLKPETIIRLRAIPVYVVQVQFETSTKARSLNAALNRIDSSQFEIAMILDADNIMKEDCLESVNAAFQKGVKALQCHRMAKNQQNPVAILDAISEEINNHLFRKGQRALGLSATPIGSGMAFKFEELRAIFNLPHILTNPGEDREVDIQLMRNRTTVEFADEAVVLDEKVSSAAVFENQRVRWIEAQLNHFRRFLQADVSKGEKNINYWNKFFQTLLLPRSLYILVFGLFLLLIIIEWIFNLHFLFPSRNWWILLMSLFAFSLLLAIPGSFYNRKTGAAILYLPVLIAKMVRALFRVKQNRTEFLHTPKTYTS
ncbi:MAG TPA: glycosyltransferase family 2 protein [Chitinophagaceae bacterium]|nr:glycosyltransferase family 2 protein [Chitinophagaceae bacterium]